MPGCNAACVHGVRVSHGSKTQQSPSRCVRCSRRKQVSGWRSRTMRTPWWGAARPSQRHAQKRQKPGMHNPSLSVSLKAYCRLLGIPCRSREMPDRTSVCMERQVWSIPIEIKGSVAKFDFWGKIQKSGIRSSTTYRLPNSRKSNFATEPSGKPTREFLRCVQPPFGLAQHLEGDGFWG